MLYIRPIKGDPYRIGDVYGFYGLRYFKGFKKNTPIVLVEGFTDWYAIKQYYPYVLATFTAGVSYYQYYYLLYLTNKLIVCFDKDQAGVRAYNNLKQRNKIGNMKLINLQPPRKDYGSMLEDEWGRELLAKYGKKIQEYAHS